MARALSSASNPQEKQGLIQSSRKAAISVSEQEDVRAALQSSILSSTGRVRKLIPETDELVVQLNEYNVAKKILNRKRLIKLLLSRR